MTGHESAFVHFQHEQSLCMYLAATPDGRNTMCCNNVWHCMIAASGVHVKHECNACCVKTLRK